MPSQFDLEDVGARPLTRRSLLKGAALGSGGLLVASALSACSAAHSGGGKSAARGLTVGTTTDLVPADFLRTASNPLEFSLVWDSLAVLDPTTLTAKPSVATGWQWNKSRTVLSIDLRDDVHYHTGRLLEPADVVFSLKEVKNPTNVAQVQPTVDLVDQFKVTGRHSLQLRLAKPMSAFEMVLVLTPLIDRETAGKLFTAKKVIGTGPFVFQSWTPGSKFSFKRNSHYWRTGLPHLDSVTVNVYSAETALANAVQASEIQLAYALTPADAGRLTTNGSFQAISSKPAYQEWYVGANVKQAPFDNLKVRQAIAYALDRERIVKQSFAGYGSVTCLPWSQLPGIPSSYADYYAYDPAKAKSLLAEAGVKHPQVTIVTAAGSSIASAILDIAQYNLNAVGFDARSKVVSQTDFTTDLTNASVPGLWINEVGLTYLELGTVLLGNAPFKVGKNTSNVTDPEYARLADAVVFARSSGDAANANRALSRYVLDQAWHLTVGHTPVITAAVKNLSGAVNDGQNALSLTEARFT